MFTSGLTYQKTITMVTEICCNCGVAFGIPSDLQEHLRNDPSKYFYCPNGHSQHYATSREQRLRQEAERELERVKNLLAQQTTAKIQVENELKKANRKIKRVHKGVCPCCNRTFSNLQRHMETKHPDHK